MAVLSVDLAYKNYRDFGLVILDQCRGAIRCEVLDLPFVDAPSPRKFGQFVDQVCRQQGIRILLLDGPQGWKASDNGLTHSRICERQLNTAAKTGSPFTVKPANYGQFVKFSIDTYDALAFCGWRRLSHIGSTLQPGTLIESFPLSAWKTLRIRPLPSKRRCQKADMTSCVGDLLRLYPLFLPNQITHDQIQAIVAGLAGLAIEQSEWESCVAVGIPPKFEDGHWREGFIVNPTRPH